MRRQGPRRRLVRQPSDVAARVPVTGVARQGTGLLTNPAERRGSEPTTGLVAPSRAAATSKGAKGEVKCSAARRADAEE